MKKVVFIVGLVVALVSLQSCTDESEQVQENAKFELQQLVDPKDDGTIKDTDPDDDGEG